MTDLIQPGTLLHSKLCNFPILKADNLVLFLVFYPTCQEDQSQKNRLHDSIRVRFSWRIT